MKYPSQQFLLSVFNYCSETGVLTRKIRPREHFSCDRTFDIYNRLYAGKDVTAKNELGYLLATINKKHYRAHRVIWIMRNGDIPEGLVIDHINGIVDDNRMSNLRAVTPTQNKRNTYGKGKQLPLGVYFDKSRGSYKASIGLGLDGKHKFKRFKTVEDAAAWRDDMIKLLGYDETHGKKGA